MGKNFGINSVPLSKLKKFIIKMESQGQPDNMPVSFEMLMMLCFPTAYKNIVEYGNQCYTKGYIQGKEDK